MNPTTQIQTGVLTVFMPNDQSAIAQHSTAQTSTHNSTAQHKHSTALAISLLFFPFFSLSFLSAFCSENIFFICIISFCVSIIRSALFCYSFIPTFSNQTQPTLYLLCDHFPWFFFYCFLRCFPSFIVCVSLSLLSSFKILPRPHFLSLFVFVLTTHFFSFFNDNAYLIHHYIISFFLLLS